jgi:Tfp pilus assembly protein PilZ
MIMAMPSRGGITTINYDTIEKLYASYLPFIEKFIFSNTSVLLYL